MEKISIDEVEPGGPGVDIDRRKLSDPLGTTDVAINRYRLAPGEGFPGGLHAHVDQKEVFVVLEGEATFETLAPRGGDGTAREAGEVTVGAGEVFRFAPGEFKSGRNGVAEQRSAANQNSASSGDVAESHSTSNQNSASTDDIHESDALVSQPEASASGDADGDLVVFALGAPRDSEDVRIPLACRECGHGDLRLDLSEDEPTLVCPDCGARHVPRACPECGHDEMHAALGGDGGVVVVCPGCGAEFEDPPLRNSR